MKRNYALHPERDENNIEGPFYTIKDGCLACALPESEAPTLLCQDPDRTETFFIKQPVTEDEINQACEAIKVCCVEALRYGGKDPEIIKKLNNNPAYCDFNLNGKLNLKLGNFWGYKHHKLIQMVKFLWLNKNT